MNTSDSKDLDIALNAALKAVGQEAVLHCLLKLSGGQRPEQDTLTIVTNVGVHNLPEEYVHGELFIASSGSLDFSSPESIHGEFRRILIRTAQKLKSKSWRKVYIIPFGP